MSSSLTEIKKKEEEAFAWTTDPKYKDILAWFTSHHTGRIKEYFHFESTAVVPACRWRRDGSVLQIKFREDGTFGLYIQLRRVHCFFQDIDDAKTKEEAMERVTKAAVKLLTTTDEMTTTIISKSEASASLVELRKSIGLDPK
jgi:hypothetical protein